jgi:hypothetical protein
MEAGVGWLGEGDGLHGLPQAFPGGRTDEEAGMIGMKKGTGYFSAYPSVRQLWPWCLVHLVPPAAPRKSSLSPFFFAIAIAGCGEPIYENAGSPHSLIEDREACAVELDGSPAALAYRDHPGAHPDYPILALDEMNRCIERKGWRQVRSQQEQEQVRDAVASEAGQVPPPVSLSDPKRTEQVVRSIEERLAPPAR